MSVIVNLALATICFASHGNEGCYPVLLGKKTPTPVGQFQMIRRVTADPGYGGDVIQFYEDEKQVYAIHRVWLLKPEQKRQERLKSKNVKDHFISSGCINVDPEVYEKLLDCCSNDTLVVK